MQRKNFLLYLLYVWVLVVAVSMVLLLSSGRTAPPTDEFFLGFPESRNGWNPSTTKAD